MASETGRNALTILLVAAVAAGGAWVWTLEEPAVPADSEETPEPEYARVFFTSESETRVETPTLDIPSDGIVVFPDLEIGIRNVTTVAVFMHIVVEGLSGGALDEIRLEVTNPVAATQEGTLSGSLFPNPWGFTYSREVIGEWRHAPLPKDAVYNTTDPDAAARWAAANHTRMEAVGLWKARVEASIPEAPLRQGNVSLTFIFRHYEGSVVLEVPSPAERPVADNTTTSDESLGPASTRPSSPRGEDVSRTFFTGTGLGRVVDRGPGPHRPL